MKMLIGKITYKKLKEGKVTNVKKLREMLKNIKIYTRLSRNSPVTEEEIGECKTESELLSKMIVISLENCFLKDKPVNNEELEEFLTKFKETKSFIKFISLLTEGLTDLVIDFSVFHNVPKSKDLYDEFLVTAKEIRRLVNSCRVNVLRILHEEAGKKYELNDKFLYVDYPLENLSNMHSYLVKLKPQLIKDEELRNSLVASNVDTVDPVYEMFQAKYEKLLSLSNPLTPEESSKLKKERAFDWLFE